jgi:hypothetical protein
MTDLLKFCARLVAEQLANFILFALLWFTLFQLPLLGSSPLFYRGVAFLALLAPFWIVLQFVVGKKVLRDSKTTADRISHVLALTAIPTSLCLSFLVVVPVTLDRSVTTFLLAKLYERGPLTKQQMAEIFYAHYVIESDGVGRRMREQILSGNVESVDPDFFQLTPRGARFLEYSTDVSRRFGANTDYFKR